MTCAAELSRAGSAVVGMSTRVPAHAMCNWSTHGTGGVLKARGLVALIVLARLSCRRAGAISVRVDIVTGRKADDP